MSQWTLVTGAGGFIGGQLVRRSVGTRRAGAGRGQEAYSMIGTLNRRTRRIWSPICNWQNPCNVVTKGAVHVYNLAADMGGMGFIENNKALCMLSVLINTHMLMAAHAHDVDRFLFSSSACVYPGYKQTDADVVALKESDAYPADPEDGYGWEKLFSEDYVGTFARITASRRA